MIINNIEFNVNNIIIFKSISKYDNNTWRGLVIGFGSYDLVKGYDDIGQYYKGVFATHPDMKPIDKLEYFILKAYDSEIADTGTIKIFAKEWVEPSSFSIHSTGSIHVIQVYDQTDQTIQNAIDLLYTNGFKCSLVT